MWTQVQPRNVYPAHPASARPGHKENEDAHAHSPSRRSTSSESKARSGSAGGSVGVPYVAWPYRHHMPPPGVSWQPGPVSGSLHESVRSPVYAVSDPFVEAFNGNPPPMTRRAGRSSIEDVPMPDYVPQNNGSLRSRVPSTMTDVSYERKRDISANANNDEVINELVEALSPLKSTGSGTSAPANTPSSVPVVATKPSAAAEVRSASYSRNANRAVSVEFQAPVFSRNTSHTSISIKYQDAESTDHDLASRNTHASPSTMVKSKKEGRASADQDDGEAEVMNTARVAALRQLSARAREIIDDENFGTASPIGEMKRKRSIVTPETVPRSVQDVTTPSPTKKALRTGEINGRAFETMEDSAEGGVSVRTPV